MEHIHATPRQRWLQQIDASNMMKPFVRPFVKSLVSNLCPAGVLESPRQAMLVRDLLPTVVSSMVHVIESLVKSGAVAANDEAPDPQKPIIMFAQQLFRRNPRHSPQEGARGTYSYKLVGELFEEELALQAVKVKQRQWNDEAPLIWELFNEFEADGAFLGSPNCLFAW